MSSQATYGSSIRIADFVLQADGSVTVFDFAIYDAVVRRASFLRDDKEKVKIFETSHAMSHEEAVQLIWAVSSSYRQKSAPRGSNFCTPKCQLEIFKGRSLANAP